MRIPLLLNFFCESQRFNALKGFYFSFKTHKEFSWIKTTILKSINSKTDERLRNVLDCVMFEPGLWQNNLKKEEPLLVPGPNRDHLSTPVGLLFNELCFSPQSVVTPMKVFFCYSFLFCLLFGFVFCGVDQNNSKNQIFVCPVIPILFLFLSFFSVSKGSPWSSFGYRHRALYALKCSPHPLYYSSCDSFGWLCEICCWSLFMVSKGWKVWIFFLREEKGERRGGEKWISSLFFFRNEEGKGGDKDKVCFFFFWLNIFHPANSPKPPLSLFLFFLSFCQQNRFQQQCLNHMWEG